MYGIMYVRYFDKVLRHHSHKFRKVTESCMIRFSVSMTDVSVYKSIDNLLLHQTIIGLVFVLLWGLHGKSRLAIIRLGQFTIINFIVVEVLCRSSTCRLKDMWVGQGTGRTPVGLLCSAQNKRNVDITIKRRHFLVRMLFHAYCKGLPLYYNLPIQRTSALLSGHWLWVQRWEIMQ